jgi:hypothetical protein
MSESRRKDAASDPFQVWREWVDQAERQLNSALSEMMETERFSKSSGRMLDLMLGFQSTMSSATQRYFSTLNLPTRTDVLQLGDRLASIEERLGLIEQALSALVPETAGRRTATAAPRPRRTRQPPGTSAGVTPAGATPGGEQAPGDKSPGVRATRGKPPARKKPAPRKPVRGAATGKQSRAGARTKRGETGR